MIEEMTSHGYNAREMVQILEGVPQEATPEQPGVAFKLKK